MYFKIEDGIECVLMVDRTKGCVGTSELDAFFETSLGGRSGKEDSKQEVRNGGRWVARRAGIDFEARNHFSPPTKKYTCPLLK